MVEGNEHGRTEHRLGGLLVAAALALTVAAGLHGLTGPWEGGFRGVNGSEYSQTFVRNFLELGPRTTQLAPVQQVIPTDPVTLDWNWHHPPLHPLLLWLGALVLGNSEWVLRLVQLLLFLPACWGMHVLVSRFASKRIAGLAALLFAAAPMSGYFGLMVIQDGAVLAFSLLAATAFVDHLRAPSLRTWVHCAIPYFVTASFDFHAHFHGISFAVLAFASGRPWVGVLRALSFLPVSLASLGLTALHYGTFLGGVTGFFGAAFHLAGDGWEQHVNVASVLAALREFAMDGLTLPLLAGAVLGFVTLMRGVRREEPRQLLVLTLALAAPGIVHCLAFAPHAVTHDYWFLPLVPAFAVPAACLVTNLRGAPGIAAWGLLVLGVVLGTAETHRRIDSLRTTVHRDRGLAIQSLTQPGDVVLCSQPVRIAAYYADRFMLGEVATVEHLEACLGIARTNRVGKRIVFLLGAAEADTPLGERLRELSGARREGEFLVHVLPGR